ncbi:MAG: hypothetical protein ACRDE2_12405 [Chitinophagaceae bacterium]
MNKKQTSPKVASKASKLLRKSKSKTVKTVAASDLSQTRTKKKRGK